MAEKKKSKIDQVLDVLKEHGEILNRHSAALLNQTNKLLEHDRKFEETNENINRKFDQVLNGQDKIIGELEKAREDRKLAKKKDDEQDRETNGLKDRVKKIEDKVLV
jgi:phage-related minor tail protein